jgi:hypothetical protein
MYARVFPKFEVKFLKKGTRKIYPQTSERNALFFFLKRTTTTTTHSFLSLFPFEEEEEEEEKEENGVHATARSPVARHRRHGL